MHEVRPDKSLHYRTVNYNHKMKAQKYQLKRTTDKNEIFYVYVDGKGIVSIYIEKC